jgi:hypothetical protein
MTDHFTKEDIKEIAVDFSDISNYYQAYDLSIKLLQLNIEAERNKILEDILKDIKKAFVISDNDLYPSALEKIAMALDRKS